MQTTLFSEEKFDPIRGQKAVMHHSFAGFEDFQFGLLRLLLLMLLSGTFFSAGPLNAKDNESYVEIPSSRIAWTYLPKASNSNETELPSWARVLAKSLPSTTAAMLELDFAYRSVPNEQLKFRSLARLAVAHVNHSPYGLAYAQFDLDRSGAKEWGAAQIDRLDSLPAEAAKVYRFAHQMSVAARDVSDDQIAELKTQLGEEGLVGLVLHIGYGNLQDRFALALNLPVESRGPLAPIDVRFDDSTPNGRNTQAAIRPEIPATALLGPFPEAEQNWADLDASSLQGRLDLQRDRAARIRVPDWEEIKPKLPEGLYPRPLRIKWSRVVVGNQPRLGPAWIKCLRVFEQEAHQDRVFEESVFWVVTRGLRCFYCMGHCEMLMEVGGLNREQIAERTERLASGDWGTFTPAEQAAFRYAYRLTYSPNGVSKNDFDELKASLGDDRALDCLWWICRCHLMTKVSDAFQLQLERENVFQD